MISLFNYDFSQKHTKIVVHVISKTEMMKDVWKISSN